MQGILPRLPITSAQSGYKREVPTTHSPRLVNWLEQLTEFRETITFTSLLKDIIKDTDEQQDKEIHMARSGCGVMELGCNHPPYVDALINL